jgi:hypothetical protein
VDDLERRKREAREQARTDKAAASAGKAARRSSEREAARRAAQVEAERTRLNRRCFWTWPWGHAYRGGVCAVCGASKPSGDEVFDGILWLGILVSVISLVGGCAVASSRPSAAGSGIIFGLGLGIVCVFLLAARNE